MTDMREVGGKYKTQCYWMFPELRQLERNSRCTKSDRLASWIYPFGMLLARTSPVHEIRPVQNILLANFAPMQHLFDLSQFFCTRKLLANLSGIRCGWARLMFNTNLATGYKPSWITLVSFIFTFPAFVLSSFRDYTCNVHINNTQNYECIYNQKSCTYSTWRKSMNE